MLVGVLGPTASGKTEVAEALSGVLSARLVSADAFQAYRGLDIGTAKPSRREDYALVDILDPSEHFGVGDWTARACEELWRCWNDRRSVVIVGGTGLYARALFEQYAEMAPPPDPELRQELERRIAEEGLEALAQELVKTDPSYAERVDLKNPVRVRRALERLSQSEQTIVVGTPPFAKLKLVLLPDREAHESWIAERLQQMFDAGWVDEVLALVAEGVPQSAPSMRAIGYRQIASVLNGVMSLDDAKQRILVETRRYAKRQRTWLRKEPQRVELEGYKEVTAAITESQRLLELQMSLGGTYG